MTRKTPEVRSDKRKPREDRQNQLRNDKKETKRDKNMSRVNYYQSAFNSQKKN